MFVVYKNSCGCGGDVQLWASGKMICLECGLVEQIDPEEWPLWVFEIFGTDLIRSAFIELEETIWKPSTGLSC